MVEGSFGGDGGFVEFAEEEWGGGKRGYLIKLGKHYHKNKESIVYFSHMSAMLFQILDAILHVLFLHVYCFLLIICLLSYAFCCKPNVRVNYYNEEIMMLEVDWM